MVSITALTQKNVNTDLILTCQLCSYQSDARSSWMKHNHGNQMNSPRTMLSYSFAKNGFQFFSSRELIVICAKVFLQEQNGNFTDLIKREEGLL